MTTGLIPVRRAVEEAVLVMAMTVTTTRVRRTHRAVRKGPGMGREERMGRGTGRRLRTGRRRERGSGKETVKGNVLLNTPQQEMISLVLLLGCSRRKCQSQTEIRRAN